MQLGVLTINIQFFAQLMMHWLWGSACFVYVMGVDQSRLPRFAWHVQLVEDNFQLCNQVQGSVCSICLERSPLNVNVSTDSMQSTQCNRLT